MGPSARLRVGGPAGSVYEARGEGVRRVAAVAVVLLAGLAACAGGPATPGEDGSPGAGPRNTATTRPPKAGDPSTTAGNGTAAAGGAVDDDGRLGSAGRELLSPASPSAVIEVDRSPGARLNVDPRAVLGEKLRQHGGKDSVTAGNDGAVPEQEVYTAEDLRAITTTARQVRSAPDRPAVYVLVLEGRYENERATGVAFSATSFAVFPEQISGGLLGTNAEAFEEAVLVHELGHLFGLVDLTGEGAFHEDPEHPGHANSNGSVMHWAVEDISITNVFRGGPPREFDAADQKEMARIRAAEG